MDVLYWDIYIYFHYVCNMCTLSPALSSCRQFKLPVSVNILCNKAPSDSDSKTFQSIILKSFFWRCPQIIFIFKNGISICKLCNIVVKVFTCFNLLDIYSTFHFVFSLINDNEMLCLNNFLTDSLNTSVFLYYDRWSNINFIVKIKYICIL